LTGSQPCFIVRAPPYRLLRTRCSSLATCWPLGAAPVAHLAFPFWPLPFTAPRLPLTEFDFFSPSPWYTRQTCFSFLPIAQWHGHSPPLLAVFRTYHPPFLPGDGSWSTLPPALLPSPSCCFFSGTPDPDVTVCFPATISSYPPDPDFFFSRFFRFFFFIFPPFFSAGAKAS